ncbi:MAG TPA: hypothetical protein DDW42_01635 [Desulfobacteraceae bacterium]|nr:hypothetical protein [Desulfobacteraceae bacterium]
MPDVSMDFEEMLISEAKKRKVAEKKVVQQDLPVALNPGKLVAFDTRAVIANLKVLEKASEKLVAEANALVIQTPDEKTRATDLSGDLQTVIKKVKKQCDDFLLPYNKVRTVVNGVKKRITDAATKTKSIVNNKIMQYKRQEELNQEKAQRIIDEQTKIVQKQYDKQAKELKITAPILKPIQAPKPERVVRGDTGASVYMRKTWKCEIVEPDNVPMALLDKEGKIRYRLCVPSQTLLNNAVKMGERHIEGCRIYEQEKPVTRSA